MKKIFFNLLRLTIFIAITIDARNILAEDAFFGKVSTVPDNIRKEMIEKTWHKGCPVGLDQLSYLQLSYWGFDNKPHIGNLIVHQHVAMEVLDIFKRLYDAHFPIEKMVIPEELAKNKKFNTTVDLMNYSETINNTSAFFCLADAQSMKHASPHSFGIAIDINPFYNPTITNQGKSQPLLASKYLDRNIKHIGMIHAGDIIFNSFLNHGWVWGGFYSKGADYMHFQKVITPYYTVEQMEYVPISKGITNLPRL